MTKQHKAAPPQRDVSMTREQDKPVVIPNGQFVPTLVTLGRGALGEFIFSLSKAAVALHEGSVGTQFDVPEKVEAGYRFTIPDTGIVAKVSVAMEIENWSEALGDDVEPVATLPDQGNKRRRRKASTGKTVMASVTTGRELQHAEPAL